MKIKHTLNAALVAAFATIAVPIASADETKPPVKEVKPAEKKEAAKPYKLEDK